MAKVKPLSVAVVRHAERADGHQAFDPWATSEDAHAFAHDPPITARGREQAKRLALDLQGQNADFWAHRLDRHIDLENRWKYIHIFS